VVGRSELSGRIPVQWTGQKVDATVFHVKHGGGQ